MRPDGARAHGDGLVHHAGNEFAAAEHVHHVDGFGDVGQLRQNRLAVDHLPGELRVDGDDVVAVGEQHSHHFKRGAVGAVAGADERNRAGLLQQAGDVGVGGERHGVTARP